MTLIGFPGAFDEPRQLMGEAALCIACYEEPEMLRDMLDTFADCAVKVIERVGETVPIDCLCVHEDMAGKSGPLFGPMQIREFFRPYYRRVWEAAKAYGARLFSQDSDGDISPILPDLIGCGLNCIHPMEPVGGNDIVELRKKYGTKICFKGGINKHALLRGPDAVRRELEYRLAPGLMGGGTVFGLDHRIPNGVKIETYRYYVSLGREMLGLPPVTGEGWARMAF
jgi:uroporphyrinogen-III decarboxylase